MSTQNNYALNINDEHKFSESTSTTHISNARVVSEDQCNIMKQNLLVLLTENNINSNQPFKCDDFVYNFKTILPNSEDKEIKKLFNILVCNDNHTPKMISFNEMLNHSSNFQKLLDSMGCIVEKHNNYNEETDYETNSDSDYNETPMVSNVLHNDDHFDFVHNYAGHGNDEELPQLPINKKVHFTVTAADNNDHSLLPQLSWRQPLNIAKSDGNLSVNTVNTSNNYGMGKSVKNVNGYNYNEYIQYQKEQLINLKNKINELNHYQIKYNELQLIVDHKSKQITNQNEEIKQLNHDKNEYIEQIESIKYKYNELYEQHIELNNYMQINEINYESTQVMAKQVEKLKNDCNESKEFGFKLKKEKQKLNELNNEFTQMNKHLRDELDKEKKKSTKIKDLMYRKDEEIKNLTLDLLSKQQFIDTLQNENEDLSNQLNMYNMDYLYDGNENDGIHSKHSSIDWKYAPSTIFTGSRRGSHMAMGSHPYLEFDIFTQELNRDYSYYAPSDIMSVTTNNNNGNVLPNTTHLHTNSSKLTLKPIMSANEYNESTDELPNVVVKLSNEIMNINMGNEQNEIEIDDEKINELQKYKNSNIRTKSIATQTAPTGFWDRLLTKMQCLPNAFDTDLD